MAASNVRLLTRLAVVPFVVAALVAGALSTPAHAQKVRPEFFGMHDSQISKGSVPKVQLGAIRLWDTGTSWREIETKPGVYDWSVVDAAVRTARAADLRPMLVLGQTPQFHAAKPNAPGAYGRGATSMPQIAAWTRYVTAAANRYKTTVDYQIWNEPNVVELLDRDGGPDGLADRYGQHGHQQGRPRWQGDDRGSVLPAPAEEEPAGLLQAVLGCQGRRQRHRELRGRGLRQPLPDGQPGAGGVGGASPFREERPAEGRSHQAAVEHRDQLRTARGGDRQEDLRRPAGRVRLPYAPAQCRELRRACVLVLLGPGPHRQHPPRPGQPHHAHPCRDRVAGDPRVDRGHRHEDVRTDGEGPAEGPLHLHCAREQHRGPSLLLEADRSRGEDHDSSDDHELDQPQRQEDGRTGASSTSRSVSLRSS